jgi:hypothetical protein
MIKGQGNNLIDGDTGEDSRSPLYDNVREVAEVKIWIYYWDEAGWKLDSTFDAWQCGVGVDELKEFIEDQHEDYDEDNITVIKNQAGYVIINYWISEDEIEKYEMFYD